MRLVYFVGGDDKAREIASGGLALVSEASLVTVGISWWRSHFPLYDKGNEPSTQQKKQALRLVYFVGGDDKARTYDLHDVNVAL